MNGIVININPVIFHIGGFELRWYTVAVILAVIAGLVVAIREGKRKGLPSDFIYSLAPWALIAGVIGARLLHVIDQWEYYAGHPLYIFQVQQGGLAIWGGLLVGGATAIACARIRHVPVGRFADTIVPALLTAQIIGRFGCIINGDAYGGITSLPWAFIYIHPDALIPGSLAGLPTHPYPVYEMLWNGAALVALLRFSKGFSKDGLLFLSYLSFYSVGRFMFSFVRQENVTLWGLQQSQLLALFIFIASLAAFVYLLNKRKNNVLKEAKLS